MSAAVANNPFKHNALRLIAGGTALAGALAIAGCRFQSPFSGPTDAQNREGITTSERYTYDFVKGNSNGSLNTPYDFAKVSVINTSPNTILVTPSGVSIKALKFKGIKDLGRPLQATDQHTKAVLQSYGCPTKD